MGQSPKVNALDIGGLDSQKTSNPFTEGGDGHEGDESKGRKRAVEAGVDVEFHWL